MTLAGVIVDYLDDPQALVVREHFGARDVPELWKTADLQSDGKDVAVILKHGSVLMPKYPLHNEGAATLSAFYFVKRAHVLPSAAREAAAQRIAEALVNYGYEPPEMVLKEAGLFLEEELEKRASDLWSLRSRSSTPPPVVDITGFSRQKSASARPVPRVRRPEVGLEIVVALEGAPLQEKRAAAQQYVAHAIDTGLPVPVELANYVGLLPDPQVVKEAMMVRRALVRQDAEAAMLEKLAEMAEGLIGMPEAGVMLIAEFDKQAGLDRHWDRWVPNPVASVYKTAAKALAAGEDDEVLWDGEGVYLTARQLKEALGSGEFIRLLKQTFSPRVVAGLRKEPVAIYKSLPEPHRREIGRLVNDMFQ